MIDAARLAVDEIAGIQHLALVDGRLKTEIKLFEGLHKRQMGQLQSGLQVAYAKGEDFSTGTLGIFYTGADTSALNPEKSIRLAWGGVTPMLSGTDPGPCRAELAFAVASNLAQPSEGLRVR